MIRAAVLFLIALGLSLFTFPFAIRALTRAHLRQSIREEGPASHYQKAGTPTGGTGGTSG